MISCKAVLRTDKINSSGLAPLTIRITVRRVHTYLFIGHKIEPVHWSKTKSIVKASYPAAKRLNNLITKKKLELDEKSIQLEEKKISYDGKYLRDLVQNKSKDDVVSFGYSWIKARLNSSNTDKITYSTYLKYNGILDKLKEFGKGNIEVQQFNESLIRRFASHLSTEKRNSQNTISSNLSFLRALSNQLIKDKLMNPMDYPFRSLKLSYVESDNDEKFLNLEELNKIENLKLKAGSKIEESRNIFLFCAFTGLRIGDAMRLKKKNFDGKRIQFFSQKTKTNQSLLLTKKALEIVRNKVLLHSDKANKYLFSFLSEAKQVEDVSALKEHKSCTALINKNLGIIAERVSIEKKISTHVGRHSLAINALLHGLTYEDIKAILNHKDIKTSQRYARVIDLYKDQAVNKLNTMSS